MAQSSNLRLTSNLIGSDARVFKILNTSFAAGLKGTAQIVCKEWQHALHIPAVRLWAYNSMLDELDLIAVSGEPQFEHCFKKASNRLPSNSYAGTAIRAGRVVRCVNPASEPDSIQDSVLTDILGQLPHIICVPVISVDINPAGITPPFRGAIDIHIADVNSIVEPEEWLLFLGEMSAVALRSAHCFERNSITQRLSRLALDVLNPTDTSRLNARKDFYLKSVKQVLLGAANAQCLSIFEAEESRDALYCVATTGLENVEDLNHWVSYRKDDGATWAVFESGEPELVRSVQKDPVYQINFPERRTLPGSLDFDPALFVPLPGHSQANPIGVIRIVERTCYVNGERLQNFSDHDLDLIRNIANQISPYLQMIRLQAAVELFVERSVHQVTQPLQGVIGYSSNLLDGLYDADPATIDMKLRYIRQMSLAAIRMLRNISWADKVNDFNFLKNVVKVPFRLAYYFLDRVKDMQPIRANERISVKLHNASEMAHWGDFWADDRYFDQVVQNLLHNAVKYSYPRTSAEVRLLRHGKDLRIQIASTGIPIQDGETALIFEDRERGEWASRYDQQGTGQGLYIARQIMRGFGGDVTLLRRDSDPSVSPPPGYPTAQRSTFEILYPGAFCS